MSLDLPRTRRTRDLRAAGATRHEIERLLPAPFWGVRSPTAEQSDLAWRARAIAPRLPEGGRFSHVTAARLYGVPLPTWAERDDRLHVAVPTGRRAPHADQVVGHQNITERGDSVVLGVPLSAPTRLFRELASLLTLDDLVAVSDRLVSRQQPLTSLEDLRGDVDRHRRFRGRRLALEALELSDPGAESRQETHLRLALIRAGLPPLIANEDLRDGMGRFIARLDLRFVGFPLAVEYDGSQHGESTQWRRDVIRLAEVRRAGIEVVRATADDLPGFDRVIDDCRWHLSRLGWRR